ncbi:MAG: phosphoglucosamine mutase, partial [Caulobacteraceae bacterium]
VSPDGANINEECGSTHPQAMAKAVRDYRADIGIALDGDADRLVICDEKGVVVDGDQIMAIIAKAFAEQGRLTGGGVVATVMSNLGLERFLNKLQLKLERTQVGDRYVTERMRMGGFNLGGEQSGHVVLSDFSTTGDGMIAALQVLAVLVKSGKSMSSLARQFEPAPQKLENVRIAGGKPLENPEVQKAIADAEAKLNGSGRLVIRASGTEPLIRIMAEGDDEVLVGKLVKDLAGVVKKAAA